jgi:adenosylmethionine-8-amino-7-oxononanoate aminotransferase
VDRIASLLQEIAYNKRSGCGLGKGDSECREDLEMKDVDIHHTYMNHPVSCAAALKNIEIIKKENLIQNAKAMGNYFLEGLKTLTRHPTVGEVRGTGLWTAIDFTVDKKTRPPLSPDRLTSLVNRAKEKGLII